MRINIADLAAQYKNLREEIEEAVLGVLRSGRYILGENVKALEQKFRDYCSVEHAIGVGSGTDALWLSLMALNIGLGDEVIMPAFTIIVDAAVVWQLKAKPVFADIDISTFNIDPCKLEEKITNKTKAIIAVHLYGQMAEMDQIMAMARRRGIRVIEDACQAMGAEYRGRKAGSIGDIGCFSFYPTKNLGSYGDGGLITTNDPVVAEKIKLLHIHGDAGQYDHVMIGHNSRLDEIQAAALRIKLKYIDMWNEARRQNAYHYTEGLGSVRGITSPYEVENCRHIYHQYTIRATQRDELRRFLHENGVGSFVYYPIPLHLQKALACLGYSQGDFPVSEKAAKEVLSLPVYPELKEHEIDYVINLIKTFSRSIS